MRIHYLFRYSNFIFYPSISSLEIKKYACCENSNQCQKCIENFKSLFNFIIANMIIFFLELWFCL